MDAEKGGPTSDYGHIEGNVCLLFSPLWQEPMPVRKLLISQ